MISSVPSLLPVFWSQGCNVFHEQGRRVDCNPAYNDMDHYVQLVGFDTAASTPGWKVRNSWSSNWGVVEFIRLPCGVNACSVASEAVFSIPSGGEEHIRSLRGGRVGMKHP